MPKKVKQNFEIAMDELEGIIKHLENSSFTLEESIEHYKKGMTLAAYCFETLQKAEQEVFIYEQNSFQKLNGACEDEQE